MMSSIINFFDSNFFQTIAVLLGGVAALVIYKLQERAKVKDAAVIVCLEIESIMNAINEIKLLKDNEQIFQTSPIYQRLYWFEYRSLFVRAIGKDNIDLINKFYADIILCEEARALFQDSVSLNKSAKTKAVQEQIAIILKNAVEKSPSYDTNTVDEQRNADRGLQSVLNRYMQLYNNTANEFHPNSVKIRHTEAFAKYNDIQPIAFQKIKKLAGITK